MNELFPLVAGMLAGLLMARLPRPERTRLRWAAALTLGLSATILSGEFRVSWAYLLIDVPLVALACAVGVALGRSRLTAPRARRSEL